jgi:sigma-E factor negative regulatory protein RseA
MSESNREHLSCLMDGELDRSAQKFLLRRLAEDSDMTATWRRFHTARACMHGEHLATVDLVSRVSTAIAEEPVAGSDGRMASWFKPVAGGAIAASVALVAIVGINSAMLERQSEQVEQPGFVSQSTSFDQPFAQSTVRSTVPVSYSETSAAERQRISGHVLRHHQASGGAGFISYVPIVTGVSGEGVEIQFQQRQGDDESGSRESRTTGR